MCYKVHVNFQEQKQNDNDTVAELVAVCQKGSGRCWGMQKRSHLVTLLVTSPSRLSRDISVRPVATCSSKGTVIATPLQPVCLDATQEEVDSFLLEEDVHRSFTKLLDRGPALLEGDGFLTPNSMAIKTTYDICQLYRCLMKDQVSFFSLSN